MTTPTPDRAGPATDVRAAAGSGSARRRWAGWVAVIVAVLAAALLLTRFGPAAANTEQADPENPTGTGAQAIARVLAERGVRVEVARGEAALRRAAVGADTTVVVTRSGSLREPTIASLAGLTSNAQRLVLIRPERRVVRQLVPEVSMRETNRDTEAAAACAHPDVRRGERLSRSQAEYALAGAVGCFDHDGYAVLLSPPARAGQAPIVLLGSTDVVLNSTVTTVENAAIGLRVLGHNPRLVWYVPDLRDAPPTAQQRADSYWPTWSGPMVLLGSFALLALLFWRGRRLGRLVAEPLPVVVRAIETTESRGRLYRKARDNARAAAVLRAATTGRLAHRLGVPREAGPAALVAAVAAATGRTEAVVAALLTGPAPTGDSDMLGLAAQLAAIEKEVRRS